MQHSPRLASCWHKHWAKHYGFWESYFLDSIQDLGDGLCALSMALPGELHGEHRGRSALQKALDGVQLPTAALIRVTCLHILSVNSLRTENLAG